MSTTSSWGSRSDRPAKGLTALFDYAAGSHRRAAAVLMLIALLAFLPGFFQIPPVDRDEAYFAQATKQMIETGDYVDIRYQDDVRYRKPVGIYWMQAAVVNAASALGLPNADTTIWLYRAPSLIGALGAVLATYWCALAFVSRRGAVLSALMMAVSTILGVEARLAKTDAVLLCTVVLAMSVLARVYLAPRRDEAPPGLALVAVFWTAIAVSILVKGPLILMVVGLAAATVSILDRSARWLLALRPAPGIAWMFALVLPWFIAIYWRVGSQFLVASVGEDMLAKVAKRARGARRAAGPLRAVVLRHLLSGFDAGGIGGAGGVGGAPRTCRALSSGLAGAVVDRVRAGGDQAAALRAAALSGDRHFDRRRGGNARPVATGVAGSRHLVVVPGAGDRQRDRGGRRGGDRSRSWPCWLGRFSPRRSCVGSLPGNYTMTTAPSARLCAPRLRRS